MPTTISHQKWFFLPSRFFQPNPNNTEKTDQIKSKLKVEAPLTSGLSIPQKIEAKKFDLAKLDCIPQLNSPSLFGPITIAFWNFRGHTETATQKHKSSYYTMNVGTETTNWKFTEKHHQLRHLEMYRSHGELCFNGRNLAAMIATITGLAIPYELLHECNHKLVKNIQAAQIKNRSKEAFFWKSIRYGLLFPLLYLIEFSLSLVLLPIFILNLLLNLFSKIYIKTYNWIVSCIIRKNFNPDFATIGNQKLSEYLINPIFGLLTLILYPLYFVMRLITNFIKYIILTPKAMTLVLSNVMITYLLISQSNIVLSFNLTVGLYAAIVVCSALGILLLEKFIEKRPKIAEHAWRRLVQTVWDKVPKTADAKTEDNESNKIQPCGEGAFDDPEAQRHESKKESCQEGQNAVSSENESQPQLDFVSVTATLLSLEITPAQGQTVQKFIKDFKAKLEQQILDHKVKVDITEKPEAKAPESASTGSPRNGTKTSDQPSAQQLSYPKKSWHIDSQVAILSSLVVLSTAAFLFKYTKFSVTLAHPWLSIPILAGAAFVVSLLITGLISLPISKATLGDSPEISKPTRCSKKAEDFMVFHQACLVATNGELLPADLFDNQESAPPPQV